MVKNQSLNSSLRLETSDKSASTDLMYCMRGRTGKSRYMPHISATILLYLLKGQQYYRKKSWIYFRVVNDNLV